MKKVLLFSVISFLSLCSVSLAADAKIREYQAKGEVVTVDPVYAQVTIAHGAIKDFSGADETVFSVSDRTLLKGLSRGDLVEFHITDTRGDAQIDRLLKTGTAPPKDNSFPVGRAVQDVLEGTGEVVKGVTTPITPVHEVTSGVIDATTGTTGSALNDASTESKTKF
jgi:Cu/Ag efflux protein CusF